MKEKGKPEKQRASYEKRILLTALMSGFPAVCVALSLLWSNGYTAKVEWTLSVFILSFWCGYAFVLRERVVRHLQTLSNLLAALREGDYSIRARSVRPDDALGEVMLEVNALGETLREQRLGAMEASALLRTVMAEIDVAIFAFDAEDRLQLINRAGEHLLGQPAERLLGRRAAELDLSDCVREESSSRTLQKAFPGGAGRWQVRHSTFRERGLQHQLLVLTDVSRALREEERVAWQRLLRVLGHELNNSLAPISSIAESLANLLERQPQPADWREDMQRGLTVIGSRSAALHRFMGTYARLARLPRPAFAPLDVNEWIRRVIRLETRLDVTLRPGAPLTIQSDGDQLDQLLINLLRNAVDAALETGGGVSVTWTKGASHLQVLVEDEGYGLSGTANLFVPFFTTKPGGAGIGLVLSRQIAEAHGGTLSLKNRETGRGCIARLRLPL